MKNLTKRAVALFLLLALSLTLAACSPVYVTESGESLPVSSSQDKTAGSETPGGASGSEGREEGGEGPSGEGSSPSPGEAFLPLSINEVMPSNKSTIADDDGLFPDWVELYNYGSRPVSLTGLVLRCGDSRWQFSPGTLNAGDYLLLFCDGSGRDERHTNFKISKKSAVISLETDEGLLIENFAVPACDSDCSAFRSDEGDVVTTAFATPGFENSMDGYERFQASQVNSSPLQIHEVMVYNQWVLSQRGHYTDWVELKNVSDGDLELSDYYLSDKGSERANFHLPSRTMKPGDIVVIYCVDDGSVSGDYCAPFALNAANDQLFLSRSDGALMDYAHLHDIPYHGSYGRMDGNNGFFYFSRPTPTESNYNGARTIAEKPTLLGRDGVFNGMSEVTVTLSAPGEIRFTTDGSEPTADSELYTGPLTLSSTTVIRAVNIESGRLNSDILELSYIINENHTLPVVSLVCEPSTIFGAAGIYNNPQWDREVPGSVTLFEDGGGFEIDCGIKLHGATSKYAQSKKSLKLNFRSRYDGELHYNLFDNGITDFSSILLRAAQESTYSTLMRDNLMHQLAIQCFPELPTQDYKYTVLYINGRYWGVYNIREAHSEDHYARHYGYDADTVSMWKEAWDKNSSIAQVCNFALNHDLSVDENYEYVASHINIDSVIGWIIIQAYCGNNDPHPPNMRFYYSTEDDMLRFALVDLDLGMFGFDMFDVPLHGSVVDGYRATYAYNKLANRLMQNRQFQLRMAEQLSAALTGPMSNENVIKLIDSLADELRPEMERDRKRWALGGRGDSAYYWEHGGDLVDYMRNYVTRLDGRARQIVNSFVSHSGLTQEEIQFYFKDVE
ncbi:MAG: CotH kinase family protein [Oscillospiraceae bacterium]|nr:CotH kinase family protein [Oscillospiraceae bacterium]